MSREVEEKSGVGQARPDEQKFSSEALTQAQLQNRAFESAIGQAEGRNAALGPLQGRSIEFLLEEINRLDSDRGPNFDDIFSNIIAGGESDINRARDETLSAIREQLAPKLGLRPTDPPIQDRAFEVGAESVRQKGQLTRDVRGGLRLDYEKFIRDLRERAAVNRLSLAGNFLGQNAQFGIGLAGVGQGTAANRANALIGTRAQFRSGSTSGLGSLTAGLSSTGEAAGGFGGGLTGLKDTGIFG